MIWLLCMYLMGGLSYYGCLRYAMIKPGLPRSALLGALMLSLIAWPVVGLVVAFTSKKPKHDEAD